MGIFMYDCRVVVFFFFFQAEDGIRDDLVTGVQTCALPICVTHSWKMNPGIPFGLRAWDLLPMITRESIGLTRLMITIVIRDVGRH